MTKEEKLHINLASGQLDKAITAMRGVKIAMDDPARDELVLALGNLCDARSLLAPFGNKK